MSGREESGSVERLVIALLAIVGPLLLAACQQDSVAPEPRLAVEVYEVGPPVVESDRSFLGTVVPADLTRVAFRVAGKIDHLAVQGGSRVVEGQVLARIEDSIQRQVMADARAQYQLSERQLQRAEKLHERGALTSAQRDQLQAGFRLARANLRLAEAGLSYTVVKAPFDGTVADVEKELFEAVTAGETVVTLYRNDRTDVLVSVPDALPARAHRARDITTLEVEAVFSGSPEVHRMSYLKSSPARDPNTQAFQFWATMPAAETPFPPGLPVTVTVDLQEAGFTSEAWLVVPLTALEAGAREDVFQVWRYADGVVNPVPVQVGRLTQDGALVSGDLRAGDQIAVSGLSRLNAGLAVDSLFTSGGSRAP